MSTLQRLSSIATISRMSHPESFIRQLSSIKPMAVLSSFGIHSSVLLHAVSKAAPDTPVVFVDTGYLPPETYRYFETLKKTLNLNVHVATSSMTTARMEAMYGRLWESDDPASHALYGKMRKKEPAEHTLNELDRTVVLSGVRASQTEMRSNLNPVTEFAGRISIHPLLYLSDLDVETYMSEYALPRHPLEALGYASVGDWHSSRPLRADDTDPRNTRFNGKFQECGLHVPDSEDSDMRESLKILSDTVPHNSGLTTRLVKKRGPDGWCDKCRQVEFRLVESGLNSMIGGVSVYEGPGTDGDTLAQAFGETRAPFFLVRETGGSWRSINSYLRWKELALASLEGRTL